MNDLIHQIKSKWLELLSQHRPISGLPREEIPLLETEQKFKFLALIPYPLEADRIDETKEPFLSLSAQNANSVLISLFEKLKIAEDTAVFSAQNVAKFPNPMEAKSQHDWMSFLKKRNFQAVFCFGMLPFFSLAQQDPQLLYKYWAQEDLSCANDTVVHVFPSPEELSLHPKWRIPVWEKLQGYRSEN